MEPRMSPFHDPTEFAEAAAVFRATPGDNRLDAALAKPAAMRVRIVTTVGVDDLGLAKRSAASATNRRDGVDQRTSGSSWVTSLRFAPVRIALTGTPLASTRTGCLEPGRARSVGFGPVFGPPQRLARTMNRQPHVRSRAGPTRAACRAAAHAICPTPRPAASRATDASRSRQSRSLAASVDGSNGYLSSERAGCHSMLHGPRPVGARGNACVAVWALEVVVRSVPTVRHR